MGYSHGALTNYSAIARDCGVDAKTVREYYQILIDTLLGTRLEPYKKRQERQVITKAGKFYLFDVGVAGAITGRHVAAERGELFGRALEHFILMELLAHRSYRDLGYAVHFWRTKSGLEVDFVLGPGQVAVEVKGTRQVQRPELRSLRAFIEEHKPQKAFLVCNERAPRCEEGILVIPWREFLDALWSGAVIS
jgi:predicted AAA+ superfamily ATPase